jgi:uncharacterized protein (TIGR02145 family)
MKKLYLFVLLSIASASYAQNFCQGVDSLYYGDQWYHSVQIGSQCWLKENLNIGKMVPAVQDQANGNSIEKYCYNNDPSNCSLYGGLYQLRTAMQYTRKNGARGICPIGWHIPSGDEFDTLISFVNGDGDALKSVGQGTGTNSSGFSAMLSGANSLSSFLNLSVEADYWTSNTSVDFHYNSLNAEYLTIQNNSSVYRGLPFYGVNGITVRCLKDNDGLLLQAPYGGEGWQAGSSHDINWGGSDIKNIKIEYSTDNGSSWSTIISTVPVSAGTYNWTIPNTPSANCRIRISDVNNPNTNSISDNVFVIVNYCNDVSELMFGGQKYHTVLIGSQCWLKENLNIGTMIPGIQETASNGIIEKYCYNDDTTNCSQYGGLYQYSEMNEPGICPSGWRLGVLADIDASVVYDANALKSVGQGSAFGAGTNFSGFSALLTGYRTSTGTFVDLGVRSFFPSAGSYSDILERAFPYGGTSADLESPDVSTSINDGLTLADVLLNNTSDIRWTDHFGSNTAGSIRCVLDNSSSVMPVELTSFNASVTNGNVKLNWNTATELNTSSFDVEKNTDGNTSWQKIASVKASGNSSSPVSYSYIDKIANAGKYNYRLKMIDNDGSYKYSSIVNADVLSPLTFELSQNYPNPFNPSTLIRYKTPISGLVSIKVFDALGKEVSTLVNEVKPSGNYEVSFNAKNLSSGIYYYQMRSGNFIETKKLTLIK